MSSYLYYEGLKYNKGSVSKVVDPLTVEAPLQININGNAFTVVMQTPGDESELAIGLLYGENIISSSEPITFTSKKNKEGIIEELNLQIAPEHLKDGYLNNRSLLSVSSCGICGKRELETLKPIADGLVTENTFSFESIFKLHQDMNKLQKGFLKTGGCHGVSIFDIEGHELVTREDIGRHNALDKAIGNLILNKNLKRAKIIAFSGRISYEIVSKAFRAKIPIITAVSAPSSLAIDFAKEYGMTLIGFCRHQKATCYAGPKRISNLIKA